jgi:hypothetical protein
LAELIPFEGNPSFTPPGWSAFEIDELEATPTDKTETFTMWFVMIDGTESERLSIDFTVMVIMVLQTNNFDRC